MADEINSSEELGTEVATPEDAVAQQDSPEADSPETAGAVEEKSEVADGGAEDLADEQPEPEVEVEEEVDPKDLEFSADDIVDDDYEDEIDDGGENVSPLEEFVEEAPVVDDEIEMKWYILKVQVNREKGICENLKRQVAQAGMEHFFADVLVPTEDVREFTKAGKPRVSKRML